MTRTMSANDPKRTLISIVDRRHRVTTRRVVVHRCGFHAGLGKELAVTEADLGLFAERPAGTT
jgi:hypothetical protein